MNKIVTTLLVIIIAFASRAFVQVSSLTVDSPPAMECTNTLVTAAGTLGASNYPFIGTSYSVVGFNITIDIEYISGFIVLPAITPFSHSINLGMLPAGNYTVTTNGYLDGVLSSSLVTAMTVISCCPADAAFTAPTALCLGDTLNLVNTSTGMTSQAWYENGSLVGTSLNYSAVTTSAGSFTYKLVVTDGSCSDSIQYNVVIVAPPVISSISASATTVCAGVPVTLTASSSGGSGQNWYEGTTPVGSGSSTVVSSTVAGMHTYSFIVSNTACSDTADISIDVLVGPIVDTFSVTSNDLCLGDMLTGYATATGGLSNNWYLDGALVGSGNNYSTTPATAGSYELVFLSSNGTCEDSMYTTINVHALPVVNLGPDTNMCGGPVVLDAGAGMASYLWSDMSVLQTLTANAAGVYYVTVTDNNGCSSTDSVFVEPCASLVDLNDVDIEVYPNPTKGKVTIEGDAFSYTLLDLSGSVLANASNVTGAVVVDLSGYSNGTYLVRVITKTGTAVGKLIKE